MKKKQKPVKTLRKAYGQHQELRDMPYWYKLVDWAELWQEFYLSLKPNGEFLYRTAYDFAKAKAKNDKQLAFLKWYLGPQTDREHIYQWCEPGPQDWFEKRKSGGWFNEKTLKVLSSDITRRMNALEALREAGNQITVRSLSRAELLAQELDRAFGGMMFLPHAPFSENIQRANAYMDLHLRVQQYLAKAQELYALSHGISFADAQAFTQLVQSALQAQVTDGATQIGQRRQALTSVVDMVLQKAERYAMDLPEGAVEVISEAFDKAKGYKQ